MKSITHTKRYLPHEMSTKINSVKLYRQTGDIGFVVRQMKELEAFACEHGRKPICVWSAGSKDHIMTQEQLAARDYILEHEELPPEYNLFIFNASSETGINIRGDAGFVVVHNSNETHITQGAGVIVAPLKHCMSTTAITVWFSCRRNTWGADCLKKTRKNYKCVQA